MGVYLIRKILEDELGWYAIVASWTIEVVDKAVDVIFQSCEGGKVGEALRRSAPRRSATAAALPG